MHRRRALLLLSLGLALAVRTAGGAEPPPRPDPRPAVRSIPRPDLTGLEPAVAAALREAAAALDGALATGTSIARAYGELGRRYHAQGFPAAAEVCYSHAADLASDDFRWPHLRGLALEEEQRLEEAAGAYAEAFRRRPYYPSLLRQARVEQATGRLERARTLLAVAAAHAPADPALLAALGEQAELEGDPARAVELLSQALALAPGATRLHYPLAQALRALGEPAAAQRHLALAGRVGIVPLDPLLDEVKALRAGARAWELDGLRAFQAGDDAAAVAAFERALAARPDDPELLARLGAAEARLGRLESATTRFARAVELAPDRSTLRFSLGSLLLGLDRPAEAIPHLERVVAQAPGDLEARALLAAARAATTAGPEP